MKQSTMQIIITRGEFTKPKSLDDPVVAVEEYQGTTTLLTETPQTLVSFGEIVDLTGFIIDCLQGETSVPITIRTVQVKKRDLLFDTKEIVNAWTSHYDNNSGGICGEVCNTLTVKEMEDGSKDVFIGKENLNHVMWETLFPGKAHTFAYVEITVYSA